MATGRLTPFSKLLIVAAVIGGLVFGYQKFGKQLLPGSKNGSGTMSSKDAIKVGVVTWGGYAGGEYFNEGFKANSNSRFTKEYDTKVEFVLNDDVPASREAWKAGAVDVLWTTIDAFPTEVEGLKQYDPVVIFQSDWSRGGDAIVVRRGINSVGDLKAQPGQPKMKIAFAEMTPSHTFLLNLFKAGELSINDVELVKVSSAIESANVFKAGRVDAAVVWSPDDEDCVKQVTGSKVLINTKTATNIIADVFFAKREWVEKNHDKVKALVEGWLKGAAEINSSEANKQKAAKILSEGLNQPEDFCLLSINNARLCTYGDNRNFYNIDGNFDGVSGEDLYTRMAQEYANNGYVNKDKSGLPSVSPWRTIAYPGFIREIKSLTGPDHAAEHIGNFTPATEKAKTAEAIATKKLSISFASGSSTLDENAKYIIDREFVDIAKSFGNARIRIEGNTDNKGSRDVNVTLSQKRAQAVAEYLRVTHHFSADRFVVVGNGPDKPVADNGTEDGKAKNRRTDFELLPN